MPGEAPLPEEGPSFLAGYPGSVVLEPGEGLPCAPRAPFASTASCQKLWQHAPRGSRRATLTWPRRDAPPPASHRRSRQGCRSISPRASQRVRARPGQGATLATNSRLHLCAAAAPPLSLAPALSSRVGTSRGPPPTPPASFSPSHVSSRQDGGSRLRALPSAGMSEPPREQEQQQQQPPRAPPPSPTTRQEQAGSSPVHCSLARPPLTSLELLTPTEWISSAGFILGAPASAAKLGARSATPLRAKRLPWSKGRTWQLIATESTLRRTANALGRRGEDWNASALEREI